MQNVEIGWRVTTRRDGDGKVVKLRLKPKGTLVTVLHDDGRNTHHYAKNLQPAKAGANTIYANVEAQ